MDFRVFYLHGLGSSCEGTKATKTKELVNQLGGEFNCLNLDYLKKHKPWDVLNILQSWVKEDAPYFLVGSSMGAYTWLDYLVENPQVLNNTNLKKVILITPPTTLFDNLEKWEPLFGTKKIFFRYGEDYIYPYREIIRLMHWDIKGANFRLLKLAHPKVYSILAKRDTVVNNQPILELANFVKLNLFEIDDEHPLRNSIDQLIQLLEKLFKEL
ncbi:MAG: YqiA/YcfP family alpha/beta fold hydrolase [Aquificota bacterium]|jgi:predicted esterase YcpF (UPF0227 family)